jgi:hypothetical protein
VEEQAPPGRTAEKARRTLAPAPPCVGGGVEYTNALFAGKERCDVTKERMESKERMKRGEQTRGPGALGEGGGSSG